MNNEHVVITVRDNISYKLRRKAQVLAYKLLGPTAMAKIYYKIVMKERLDLKEPKTFTEKISWYKLRLCPNNELIVQCSDKYGVRAFIEELGLGKYLSELIGVWERPEDIDFEALPQKFALKNSNGCGCNIICDDKSFLDEVEAKRLLSKWLKEEFGCYNAEPHYNVGKKYVICEKYIESESLLPIDYKIHCMNGQPRVVQVCEERTSKHSDYIYYGTDMQPLDFGVRPDDKPLDMDTELFGEMLGVSERIAAHFPYVRVDFFISDGALQISELTFSPSAGLKPDLKYGDGDKKMGDMWDISGMVESNAT